jgi:VanZ family protein
MKTGKTFRLSHQQREQLKQQRLQERFFYESTKIKGYELIYPSADQAKNDKYNELIRKSQDLWDDFYVGKNRKKEQINLSMKKLMK